jgi:adenine-specific DNA-methyltransferase
VSSDENDVVADFFCGGGTTLAVAQRLKRRFIGCDSSRVAVSVSLDRLVKIGEEMSGVTSNIHKKSDDDKQAKLGIEFEKVPNIEISYLGVYPTEKFASIPHDEFVDFILTCYGASKNTAEGKAHGFRPPGQSEPILVGPSNPNESVSGKEVKAFFDEIKQRLEPNKLVSAKIIGWRFDRQITQYIKILEEYIFKHNLPMKIELIPLDSREFRARVLQRYPDTSEAEFFLRFSKAPVIGDIKVKKIKDSEYEFEAVDAFSTNEDGWLVNCQWDFDYQEGHFAADKDYVLSRDKVKEKRRGEIFKAALKARHIFEKSGEYMVACRVQDNLAGEAVFSKKIKI